MPESTTPEAITIPYAPLPVDTEVKRLVESLRDCADAMPRLIERLRSGDSDAAVSLWRLAKDGPLADVDTRALALETLAAARQAAAESLALSLIQQFLVSQEDVLRFAAIAAAGDLSPVNRTLVRAGIARLAQASPAMERCARDVQAAAQAFIAAHGPAAR